MKLFIYKIAAFSSVFIIIFGMVAIIDPFQRFDNFMFFNHSKKGISLSINTPLWKIIEYRKDPKPNLIFGDSRMKGLDSDHIEEVTGKKFYNFAYGGATFEEMSSSFWIAVEQCDLESVCFGVNLNNFNINNSRNRVPGAYETACNPFLYLINCDVVKASYLIFESSLKNKKLNLGRPDGTREQFWHHILDVTIPRFYLNFRYDNRKLSELNKIGDFCQKNGIALSFIIPFSHMDVQKKVDTYVSKECKLEFRSHLAALGPVFDFNYANDITKSSDLFRDPNHFAKQVSDLIIDEVWGGRIKYAKVLGILEQANKQAPVGTHIHD